MDITLLSSSVTGPRAISTPILFISRLAYCFLLPVDLKMDTGYSILFISRLAYCLLLLVDLNMDTGYRLLLWIQDTVIDKTSYIK